MNIFISLILVVLAILSFADHTVVRVNPYMEYYGSYIYFKADGDRHLNEDLNRATVKKTKCMDYMDTSSIGTSMLIIISPQMVGNVPGWRAP